MARQRIPKHFILDRAQFLLDLVDLGYQDAIGDDPTRMRAGATHVFTYGQSIRYLIPRMRRHDEARFDAWWVPYGALYKSDPLLKYFGMYRDLLIHEGASPAYPTMSFEGTDFWEQRMAHVMRLAPPDTVGVEISGPGGGNYFRVRTDDSGYSLIPFQIPEEAGIRQYVGLPNPPTSHRGAPINDDSATHIEGLYVGFLHGLVADFQVEFR